MRAVTPLAFMACVAMTIAIDISYMADSVYKVPIAEDGQFDYGGALNLTPRGPRPPANRMVKARAVGRDDSARTDDDEDDENETDDEYDDDDVIDSLEKIEYGKSHCHKHWPRHHTAFVLGNATMSYTNFPLSISMLSTHSRNLSRSLLRFASLPQTSCHSALFILSPPLLRLNYYYKTKSSS